MNAKQSHDKEFYKLLLSELRWVTYIPAEQHSSDGKPSCFSDKRMQAAVTANEMIASLGYTLTPPDVVRLAESSSLGSFPRAFKELLPDVKAEPMYPDFPYQVMEMSEAVFRFHQAVHYFSTYGVEFLTGMEVKKGWLPAVDSTEKTQKDTRLFSLRAVELVPEGNAPLRAIQTLCARGQRLYSSQIALIRSALGRIEPTQLQEVSVSFKENLYTLFQAAFSMEDSEKSLAILHSLCSHTGDVLKCARKILSLEKYHLRTGQKKRLVRLLESYPVEDFRRNLIRSAKTREMNLIVLQYLDYNRFSRSDAHRMAVEDLRADRLRSWESVARKKVAAHTEDALSFAVRRPGMLFRWNRWLLKLGYSEEEILEAYEGKEKDLHMQTIISTIEKVGNAELCLAEIQAEQDKYLGACRYYYHRADILSESFHRSISDNDYQTWLEKRNVRILRQIQRLKLAGESSLLEEVEREENRRSVDDYMRKYAGAYNYEGSDADKERKKKLQQEIEALEAKIAADRMSAIDQYSAQMGWMKRALVFYQWKKNETFSNLQSKTRYYQRRIEARKKAIPYDQETVEMGKKLLAMRMSKMHTPLLGKRVYLDLSSFALDKMRLQVNAKDSEGGYFPKGTVFKIPEQAKKVRFFVYWNDERRVDIDLHVLAHKRNGQYVHVGWNADFKNEGIVYSGDITYSDAAEYIDIDLDANIRDIRADIALYYGAEDLADVETCYVGMMAVDKTDRNVKLYDPANCFFTHEVHLPVRAMLYGYVDVQNRCVRFCGEQEPWQYGVIPETDNWAAITAKPFFPISEYLHILFAGQHAQETTDKESADVVLTMGKSSDPRAVSLVDHNFFLDY